MRNVLFASAFILAASMMVASVACSSSTGGTGGSTGSGGSSGTGGSGGSGGSGGACSVSSSKVDALGFNATCNTCIGAMCCDTFNACEADPLCAGALTCVAKCYHAGGTLEMCAEVTCVSAVDGGPGSDGGSMTRANNAILCIANGCQGADSCGVE